MNTNFTKSVPFSRWGERRPITVEYCPVLFEMPSARMSLSMTTLVGLVDKHGVAIATDGRSIDNGKVLTELAVKSARLSDNCCIGMAGKAKYRVPIAANLLSHPKWASRDNVFEKWEACKEMLEGSFDEIRSILKPLILKHGAEASGRKRELNVMLAGREGEKWKLYLWRSDDGYEAECRVGSETAEPLGSCPEIGEDAGNKLLCILQESSNTFEDSLVAAARYIESQAITETGYKTVNTNILVRSSSYSPCFVRKWIS